MFESTATNHYLDTDGMLNRSAVSKLATQAAKEARALGKTAKLKVIYYTGAELPKYSAYKEKRNIHQYAMLRAQQVKEHHYNTAELVSKLRLITVYEGFSEPLKEEIRKLESAITQHNKKAEDQVAKFKAAEEAIRAKRQNEIASNIEEVKSLMGLKKSSFFTGRIVYGGSGTVLFVTLPNGNVVTVHRSSAEQLRMAKQAAKKGF